MLVSFTIHSYFFFLHSIFNLAKHNNNLAYLPLQEIIWKVIFKVTQAYVLRIKTHFHNSAIYNGLV